MNLLHLRYFYEVARLRSFTECAKTMRISQPAISKMVRELEAHLGKTLFERSKKGVTLTEHGEVLFQSASRIFSEVEEITERLKETDTRFQGAWSLGVSDNIALYLVPSILGKFKEKHPSLRISLFAGTSSQIKNEILADRCRLGIFFTPVKSQEPFESAQVAETEFWAVIAAKNRWLAKKKLSLEDLKRANVPRIESRHSDYSAGFPAHFHSKHLGLTGAPWLEVNQHEVKKKLVLGGFGFALLTKHTIEEEVRSEKLIRVDTNKKLRAPIYAVWKKGRAPGRIAEAFLADFQSAT